MKPSSQTVALQLRPLHDNLYTKYDENHCITTKTAKYNNNNNTETHSATENRKGCSKTMAATDQTTTEKDSSDR